MKRFPGVLIAASLASTAAPALAQNSSAAAPAPSTPPKTDAPTSVTPPAPSTTPPEPPPAAPAPVIVQPVQQPAPQQPVAISPDANYPNGFQDPANPFANEARAYNDQDGFDWGLLGLLGLLGLIPLIRGGGGRTVYVEREEPRRVVRTERIDEDQA